MGRGGCQMAKGRLFPRWSGSQRHHFQLRSRSKSWWCESPSHQCQRWLLSSSPSPSRSGHSSKWLYKLQGRTQRSRSRAQQGRVPTLVEDSFKKAGLVWPQWGAGWQTHLAHQCDSLPVLGERPLSDIPLPPLAKMGPVNALQPDHEEGPQQSSTPPGGARLKVLASTIQPQLRPEGPDTVSHHCR